MQILKLVFTMPLLLAALGCAGTKALTEAERKTIQSVTVSTDVAMPPRAQVAGPSANKGAMILGPLAMVAIQNSENEDAVAFKKHLEDNKVDMREIVRDAFVAELRALEAFPAIVAEGGQAKFDLTIEVYGLGPGFSMAPINKPLRPVLVVGAKLSTPDGKLLWENRANITGMSDLPAYQIDDYYSNAERTRASFNKAAAIVTKELVATLKAP